MATSTILVNEIFNSIQGEGMMLGQAATFVRLSGCNLRCPWCDTKMSWYGTQSRDISIADIIEACTKDNVIITGGEPCLNPQLPKLVQCLKKAGHYVCIETNGTLPTPEGADWVTCSPKPGTGVPYPAYYIHPKCNFNELKFVVTEDMNLHDIILPVLETTDVPVWLQPNGYDLLKMASKIHDFVVAINNPQVKLGVQLHKIYQFQ